MCFSFNPFPRMASFPISYAPSVVRNACMYPWLHQFRAHDILYGKYLFNHWSHNVIVIGAVGYEECEAERKITDWNGVYTRKHVLSPPRGITEDMPMITNLNWKEHFGDPRGLYNQYYPTYLAYFDAAIRNHGMKAVVNMHYPVIIHGMAACALHPVIHTGWGIEADHDATVAEGLASMCTMRHKIGSGVPKWTPGEPNMIDATIAYLVEAEDMKLHDIAAEAARTETYQTYKVGAFQRIVLTFDDNELPLGKSLDDCCPLMLPDVNKSLDSAIVQAMTLMAACYLVSDCEFFYIHGLTSLHAVVMAIDILESPVHKREALVHWWRTVMAVVVCQRVPQLLEKVTELLSETKKEYPVQNLEDFWKTTIDLSLTSDDEHVSKAVYVLWRWSQMIGIPSNSVQLFQRAAANQVRPHKSGGPPHNHLWFAGY